MYVRCTFQTYITVKIVETIINEIDLAIEHLNNLKQILDITTLLIIYGRGYPSIELMAKTIDLNSKFFIRLPKIVFTHQIKQRKTNDEIIQINMTNNRLNNFNDEN